MRKHDSPLPEEGPYQIWKKFGTVVSEEKRLEKSLTPPPKTSPTHANSLWPMASKLKTVVVVPLPDSFQCSAVFSES